MLNKSTLEQKVLQDTERVINEMIADIQKQFEGATEELGAWHRNRRVIIELDLQNYPPWMRSTTNVDLIIKKVAAFFEDLEYEVNADHSKLDDELIIFSIS